ncbi:MAG: TIGR04283 family arsenosugar biosynthesis glycosyltransferase [Acetobacteraceae bacterium]
MDVQCALLSVIIPLAPGEEEWRDLLAQLAQALTAGSEVILVSAGGVMGEVPEGWPSHLALHWYTSSRGRAVQMNFGARAAVGKWLWFLHADSRLQSETIDSLARFIAKGEPALGWFDLAFRSDGPRLTWLNACGANLRARWLGLPFGDQGLLLPASTFAALGGYDERAGRGEDHLLVWAARHAGLPLRGIGARLATSGRRYREQGWAATTLQHLRLTATQAWQGSRSVRRGRAT